MIGLTDHKMRWLSLVLVATLTTGCSHDLESVLLPCDDKAGCPTGSTCVAGRCVVTEAGSPDAGKDLPGTEAGKPEAGSDILVDQTVSDKKKPADNGPGDSNTEPDKALFDLAKPDKAAPDQSSVVDQKLPDQAAPDQKLPDQMLPDQMQPDLVPAPKCGDGLLHASEPCDGALFPNKKNLCTDLVVKGVVYTGGVLGCVKCVVDTSFDSDLIQYLRRISANIP